MDKAVTVKLNSNPSANKPQKGRSFTFKILTGLFSGIFVGLLVGDYTEHLKIIGDVYVALMQMTVIPYIFFSLIGSIGRLSKNDVNQVAKWVLIVQSALWICASIAILWVAQSFPTLEHGSFFSSSKLESPHPIDFVELFIPSNLFRSLTENAVPAIVVFCALFGYGLISLDEKKGLIDQIGQITRTLQRVNGMVVRMTPIGTFGIAAYTAGTMTLEELEKLQAYYLSFGLVVMILTFVIMPLIVTTFTPFSYKSLMNASKNALLTCFVTGSVLSVIPMLVKGIEEMFAELETIHKDEVAYYPEFVVPLAYPFPNSGNAAALIFIPFASWYLGQSIELHEQIRLMFIGFFLMFGKVFIAVPFLLDTFHIPLDMFQLFLAAGVISSRLGDVLGSMHQIVFTILTTAAMAKVIKVNWSKLIKGSALVLIILTTTMIGLEHFIRILTPTDTDNSGIISELKLLENGPSVRIQKTPIANPKPLAPGGSRLDRIIDQHLIRVGFIEENLPYSYFNSKGDLVGLDIDMITKLARDLNVDIEFTPYLPEALNQHFKADHFDLAVSGVTDTTQGFSQWLTTDPYLVTSMGFLVKDHDKHRFDDKSRITEERGIRIGVIEGGYFENWLKINFPQAELVQFESLSDFFSNNDHDPVDAVAAQAESASAWTLLYPAYTVVIPKTKGQSAPVSIAVGGYDVVLRDTLNNWITHQKMNGSVDRWFNHWILGRDHTSKPPRWSFLKNVLHLDRLHSNSAH